MAALTAGMNRPGATADLGAGVPPAARTTGPAGGDQSAVVSSGTRTVRSWPLLVLAAPAAAEVWSGWVGIAQKTGFGLVSPLPGILPSLHLDTSITLPVGVEAYAAYALRAWLAGEHAISGRTRRFAKWSAICSFALGMAGQVAYHLLAQAGAARAPWPVTTIVSCLPVLVLAMGTALAHMLRADAGTAADEQADLDLLPADHDCPAHGDRKFVRTARRYRTIEIQVGPHTTAADPLPDDLHHAIETIARPAEPQEGNTCTRHRRQRSRDQGGGPSLAARGRLTCNAPVSEA